MPENVIQEDRFGEMIMVPIEFVAQPAPEAPETTPPAPEPESTEVEQPVEETPPSERQTATKPAESTWDEWRRRQDAIRTLAREFDEVDHGDIREYLLGRTSRELTDDEVGQIKHDVTAQRVADVTDVLDEQLRSTTERMKRARRTVRVQAPRGWIKRTFNLLDERAVGQVAARLIQRGHDPEIIKEKVVNRTKDEEVRNNIHKLIDNEELLVEFDAGSLTPPPQVPAILQPGDLPVTPTQQEIMAFAQNMAESIASNMPVPDIYVEVPVNVGGAKKRVKRNAETGLIEEIEEE